MPTLMNKATPFSLVKAADPLTAPQAGDLAAAPTISVADHDKLQAFIRSDVASRNNMNVLAGTGAALGTGLLGYGLYRLLKKNKDKVRPSMFKAGGVGDVVGGVLSGAADAAGKMVRGVGDVADIPLGLAGGVAGGGTASGWWEQPGTLLTLGAGVPLATYAAIKLKQKMDRAYRPGTEKVDLEASRRQFDRLLKREADLAMHSKQADAFIAHFESKLPELRKSADAWATLSQAYLPMAALLAAGSAGLAYTAHRKLDPIAVQARAAAEARRRARRVKPPVPYLTLVGPGETADRVAGLSDGDTQVIPLELPQKAAAAGFSNEDVVSYWSGLDDRQRVGVLLAAADHHNLLDDVTLEKAASFGLYKRAIDPNVLLQGAMNYGVNKAIENHPHAATYMANTSRPLHQHFPPEALADSLEYASPELQAQAMQQLLSQAKANPEMAGQLGRILPGYVEGQDYPQEQYPAAIKNLAGLMRGSADGQVQGPLGALPVEGIARDRILKSLYSSDSPQTRGGFAVMQESAWKNKEQAARSVMASLPEGSPEHAAAAKELQAIDAARKAWAEGKPNPAATSAFEQSKKDGIGADLMRVLKTMHPGQIITGLLGLAGMFTGHPVAGAIGLAVAALGGPIMEQLMPMKNQSNATAQTVQKALPKADAMQVKAEDYKPAAKPAPAGPAAAPAPKTAPATPATPPAPAAPAAPAPKVELPKAPATPKPLPMPPASPVPGPSPVPAPMN